MNTLSALVHYLTFVTHVTQLDNDPLNDWITHLAPGLQAITYLVGLIITG